jgi:hypothetical protein
MATLVPSIFDLAAGDPAAKEQSQFGALGDYETGTGEGLTTAGAGYDLGVLSGDPTKIATTLVPEISTGQGQVEQQRLQDANFGTRSGGTVASTEAAEATNRGNIISLEGGLQSAAASSALGAGSGLLSEASPNIGNEAKLAEDRRKQVTGDVGGIATGAAEIASGLFGGAAGGIDAGTFDDLMKSGTVPMEQIDASTEAPTEIQM